MLNPTSVPMSRIHWASDTTCLKVSTFSSFAHSKRRLLVLSVELVTELTNRFGIVSGNQQNPVCLWMCSGDFHQFNFTVKSQHLDSVTVRILDWRHLVTRTCIYNPLWRHPKALHQLYFSLACTVNSCPNSSSGAHYGPAVVTLYCIKGINMHKSFSHLTCFFRMAHRFGT